MRSSKSDNLRFDLEDEQNGALDALRELHLLAVSPVDTSVAIDRSSVKKTPTSVEFDSSMPIEEWEAFGQDLKRAAHGVSWYIGDWLNFGKDNFPERYEKMMPVTNLKKQQLQNIAWIAGKFSPDRRRASLSFRHHELVAALPQQQQDALLTLAEENKWRTARFRSEIATVKATGKIGHSVGKLLTLPYRGLLYEPINEQGVVFLFALMAKDIGFLIEAVQSGFPDCIAKREIRPGIWQQIRIEFEFESRNFNIHKHCVDDCDLIVCWRDNWPECPESLEVVELEAKLKVKLKDKLKALSDADAVQGD